MSDTLIETPRNLALGGYRARLFLLGWNVFLSAAIATAASKSLLGRTNPTEATLAWLLSFLLFFCVAFAWLTIFSSRLSRRVPRRPGGLLRTLAMVEGPLAALSLGGVLAIYVSDEVNHQSISFLHPVPAVILLLAVLITAMAHEAVLRPGGSNRAEAVLHTLSAARGWALPVSLLLLGLLQGSSYLWVIGNDFIRYWAVADAISSLAGYPATVSPTLYSLGGMTRYWVESPMFPILLVASFTFLGHDTLGAHLPALLANTALPLLVYILYRKAGLERILAFAGSAAVVTFPLFRLYTLNAPVPDAVFVGFLVATGCAFAHLVVEPRGSRSGHRAWMLFGLLGGLAALTRPEGLLFVGVMFVALLPNLLSRRLYLAVGAFLVTIAPFSLLSITTFGTLWPRNFGSSMATKNFARNLDWLQRVSLSWYVEAFGLSIPTFLLLLGVGIAAAIAGTLWLSRRRWQLAALPVAGGIHIATVFSIDPRVAGADQWFDFFRHISYGLPFIALPLLFLVSQAARVGGTQASPLRPLPDIPQRRLGFNVSPAFVVGLLVLLFAAYELRLLAYPSRSMGGGATQLLTSDVWVSFPDIVANRYPLPRLEFTHRERFLVLDPDFRYMRGHLDSVSEFFEPFSTLNTGRGKGFQLASLLVILFGTLLAVTDERRLAKPNRTRESDPPGSMAPESGGLVGRGTGDR